MIKIIHEDTDIIVIDKPSGIIVNRADTTKGEITVQDWAEEKLKVSRAPRVAQVSREKDEDNNFPSPILGEGQGEGFENAYDTFFKRGGIVHRLDKETSGILLIAKTPSAFVELQRQFKERVVKKTYIALAHGKVAPAEGEISVPIGRLPWNRRQFGVVAGGREALTRYKTITNYKFSRLDRDPEWKLPSGQITNEPMTLLELYPETGRTHQIRVHLKYIGFPIYGDFLYAGRKTQRNDRKSLSRVFLHAAKISFLHPSRKESVTFSSKLPLELEAVLLDLQQV